jgi:hypothetical protein
MSHWRKRLSASDPPSQFTRICLLEGSIVMQVEGRKEARRDISASQVRAVS